MRNFKKKTSKQMNQEKYQKSKQDLIGELLTSLRELDIKYLESNDSIKVGDIIEDNLGKIQVTRVVLNSPSYKYLNSKEMLLSYPYTTYVGNELKKNGEPKKIPSQRTVYKSNLKN